MTEPKVGALSRARRDTRAALDQLDAMTDLPTPELIAMLEDRERRLPAALTMASRKEPGTLPPLFAVMRRMSRVEANALLPRLAAFGSPAEKWLIDGLRSKKAFMRQGSALALGRLGTPLAVDALVRLLVEEPTEIWSEVARALGDIGTSAVMPLAARLREVDEDNRERIVQALAHVASRSSEGGPAQNRQAIETLATGRDALVANAAKRALQLAPDVRSAHEAVRLERREQTLVRAFTRRFYDSLDHADSGEFILDPQDIEELDEMSLEEEAGDLDDDPIGGHLDESDLEPLEPSQPRFPLQAPRQ
jgi:hypothetical protein